MAAITSMNLAAVGNNPTSNMPTRVLGLSFLTDVQLTNCKMPAFNFDKTAAASRRPMGGIFARIFSEMGCTAQNLQEGFSKARQGGDQQLAQLASSAGPAPANIQYNPVDTSGGGSWANYVTTRGPRGGGYGQSA